MLRAMSADGLSDDIIRGVLGTVKRIALVGASANPARPSYRVMQYLLARGYDVTPVNPGLAGQKLHGREVVASLDKAGPLEMVDLFRASEHVAPAVDDAIRLGARVVWMQLRVIDEESAAKARAAGITVVMDRCPAIERPRLGMD